MDCCRPTYPSDDECVYRLPQKTALGGVSTQCVEQLVQHGFQQHGFQVDPQTYIEQARSSQCNVRKFTALLLIRGPEGQV